MMKKILAAAIAAGALALSAAPVALASEAHPKPGTSCSILGSRGVYHVPHTHHLILLRCERVHGHDTWVKVGSQ